MWLLGQHGAAVAREKRPAWWPGALVLTVAIDSVMLTADDPGGTHQATSRLD